METALIIGAIALLLLIILWNFGGRMNKGCITVLLVIIVIGFLISAIGQCASSSHTGENNWMDNPRRP